MDELVRFIHEVGSLKLVPRSGWLKLGFKLPESVAEHSFRTAVIAFILALKGGRSLDEACRAAVAALFHDMHEARTMDLHKIARNYVDIDAEKAWRDQLAQLGVDLDFSDVESFVRDADKLELAFQAVEYAEINPQAMSFAENIVLETEVGRQIYASLMERRDPRWWIR